MKLPLWAWDEIENRWAVLPRDHLETFEDGTQGFTIHPLRHMYGNVNVNPLTPFGEAEIAKRDMLKRFPNSFVLTHLSKRYSPETTNQRYIFKYQKRQSTHRFHYSTCEERWMMVCAFTALGFIAAMILICLWIFVYSIWRFFT